MQMNVTFPGGKKVDVQSGEYTIHTDQPVRAGGGGTAPSPFELFLASLAACAGFYVLDFCQHRNIDTAGIEVVQSMERDPASHMVSLVRVEIRLPAGFPEKYKQAVVQAASLCAVKKHIEHAPRFEVVAVTK